MIWFKHLAKTKIKCGLMVILNRLIFVRSIYSHCGLNKYWNNGYAYRQKSCNDIESFELCEIAQKKLTDNIDLIFHYTNNTTFFVQYDLNCGTNILCVCDKYLDTGPGTFYCQNNDSINNCLRAAKYLEQYSVLLNEYNSRLPNYIIVLRPIIKCQTIPKKYICYHDNDVTDTGISVSHINIGFLYLLIFLVMFGII